MSSMSAASPDICGTDVQALYLEDPGNKQEPVGFVLCSEMGNTCMKNGCSCRSTSSATVDGSTKYFGVCVVLKSGADCVTSGDDYVTCATGSGSSSISSSSEAQSESSVTEAPTTKAATESKSVSSSSASTSASASGGVDVVKVSSTAASTSSMSTTVLVVIIVVAVVFVALVSWVVRAYCMRRASDQSKLASRRNRSNRGTNFEATSPTINGTNRSSATPSFPAFDRRTRAMQSPTTARGRGNQDQQRAGRNTPRGREPSSGRGRRTPDIEFGPTGGRREPTSGRGRPIKHEPSSGRGRPMIHEPTSGRGRRNPELTPPGPRREPTSGRGKRVPDIDAQFAPHGPRGFPVVDMPPREPTSGRGRRTPDMNPAEAAMRTPPRAKQQQQPARSNAPEPPGGTVYTGRNTYERVAQFAQLAAFEAPPPPPPRPQRPIQPVPVSNPVPNHARGPAPMRPSRPAPKRPGFHIPDDPLPEDYDILSPKTARSLAPSVASSATTVVAPGRNRPTPLQQHRRQQYSTATPSYYQSGYSREDNKYDESRLDESKFDESKYDESGFQSKFVTSSNYDDSFVSEVSSDMAWSGASGLSDDSYYHAAGSNTARIPVIDVPRDDDSDSDWGHSTQQSNDFRSTAASDRSFFSVNSDFTDSKSTFKESEF